MGANSASTRNGIRRRYVTVSRRWRDTHGDKTTCQMLCMAEHDWFEKHAQVPTWVDAKTPIKNLWLTGQDTVTCGQPIGQAAGLISAFRMAGLAQTVRYLARTLPPIVRAVRAEREAQVPPEGRPPDRSTDLSAERCPHGRRRRRRRGASASFPLQPVRPSRHRPRGR